MEVTLTVTSLLPSQSRFSFLTMNQFFNWSSFSKKKILMEVLFCFKQEASPKYFSVRSFNGIKLRGLVQKSTQRVLKRFLNSIQQLAGCWCLGRGQTALGRGKRSSFSIPVCMQQAAKHQSYSSQLGISSAFC